MKNKPLDPFVDRAQRDPEYREALLKEAINEFLFGDVQAYKFMFHNYIRGVLGSPTLSQTMDGLPFEFYKANKDKEKAGKEDI